MTVDLVQQALEGERRALARLLTIVENGGERGQAVVTELFPRTGNAWLIGITGSPGTGKSTLVSALALAYRAEGKRVGIVAVDPTSPFSGGAILGDRVRMMEHIHDPGVFMRSMATRGQLGGLARATLDVARVFDACGYDIVIVETVGVGQDEVDVASATHTTVLVQVPGLGDDVQAIKAGVMEIGDIYVVNKADRDGADRLVAELTMLLSLSEHGDWLPPIVRTIATQREGVDSLVVAIRKHREHLETTGRIAARRLRQSRSEIMMIARDELLTRVERNGTETLTRLAAEVAEHRTPPFEAARQILALACRDDP